MSKFHLLKVIDVKKETADCVSIAFEIPSDFKKIYHYEAGQYVTLKTIIDGEDIRRSYSICSSPLDDELRIAVKKVENGKFSTWANTMLKIGDTIEVMTPMGHFSPKIDLNNKKSYLLFASGSGITPVISILKTILKKEVNSNVTLVYGNKGNGTIIFKEELEALKNSYLDRFSLLHVFSKEKLEAEILCGRIDGKKCNDLAKFLIDVESSDEAYLCGPQQMVEEVSEALQGLGMKKENIFFELFGAPLPTAGAKENQKKDIKKSYTGDKSHVTIILDGKETSFDLATEGDFILDAAMKAGADAPYACKGAVCCTCRAQVIEGEAQMEMNYSLTDVEVENGFILTCQAHPVTERVVVNFDVS